MSEVLSQSEIDALLSAIHNGEIDANEIRSDDRASRVRSYDFRRAMRFSKDHLRALRRIHEHFSRLLTTHLSGQLRTVIQIQVESVDQVPYEEFIRSIPMLTVLQLMEMTPLEGRVVLEMNPQVVFAMLDRFMGGDNAGPYRERELTDIETTLMRRLMTPAADLIAESWRGVAEVEPEFVGLESNPQFLQLTTPNETVLVIAMSVRIGDTTGLINLCIPHTTVEPIMPTLNNRHFMDSGRRRQLEPEEDEMVKTHVLKVPVDVEVQLGSTELTVNDVLNLEVGDTVLLRQSIRDPALVFVDGTAAYWGSIGKRNRNYAIKILREWEGASDSE
ncbi:flagellar motor switch protein FliM [Alicyclobacillus fastidiosus]|uniref:Flagellar motor switch protein FliM n=1 Tax=Alicyclobacillus fastidiosus TaxID=392011 RepID=A0ABY6ZBF9_9BACL|nr:flagellar motor switch protein FliM [Alicyclobacillus fastidiosus]WAH40201.1 flagellar motor switch protein FliM [Alicyclobacillus fastidiosus]GMA61557.1 flagellar motor switch protein FliM [Alicyclobacillus fastidiosus]